MKVELSSKKIEITQMARNTVEAPQGTINGYDNLPNDLVGVLKGLKEKLDSMKEFYDSNATDDTVEDKMIR